MNAIDELLSRMQDIDFVKARFNEFGDHELVPAEVQSIAGVDSRAAGDVELAQRFARLYRGKLLWINESANWLKWTGTAWAACENGEELRAAEQILLDIVDEARERMTVDRKGGGAAMREALSLQRESRIRAMIALAKAEPGMSAGLTALDANPMLLGVVNGVVDLVAGTLIPARPEQYISRQCSASFSQEASCPHWLQFLSDIFQGDQSIIDSVQRLCGYSLTGSNTEEVLVICYGHGANGKSVFHNVISAIFADYSRNAPPDILVQKQINAGGPSPALAMLAGVRLVGINELAAGDKLDEQALKSLAGREPITARHLYGSFFEYTPQFCAWLRTNHKPIITGTDHAVWRRLVVLPFLRQFNESERDKNLETKLLAERDGVLSWMVEGARLWCDSGLALSDTIQREVATYRTESDVLGQFLSEVSMVQPDSSVPQQKLYQLWALWCAENGLRPSSKQSFTRRLAELGFSVIRKSKVWCYSGLALSEDDPENELSF